MSKIYKGQTAILVSLITGIDLTNATTALIKYTRPDKTQGQWTAEISGQLINYQAQSGDFSQSGIYSVWPHITFADSTVSIGEPQSITIYEEGQ